jgi:hypothetical protein
MGQRQRGGYALLRVCAFLAAVFGEQEPCAARLVRPVSLLTLAPRGGPRDAGEAGFC